MERISEEKRNKIRQIYEERWKKLLQMMGSDNEPGCIAYYSDFCRSSCVCRTDNRNYYDLDRLLCEQKKEYGKQLNLQLKN